MTSVDTRCSLAVSYIFLRENILNIFLPSCEQSSRGNNGQSRDLRNFIDYKLRLFIFVVTPTRFNLHPVEEIFWISPLR